MVTVLYRCPGTGFRVQGYTAEEMPADRERYEPVTCLACKEVHLVNLKTGEVLTTQDDHPPILLRPRA